MIFLLLAAAIFLLEYRLKNSIESKHDPTQNRTLLGGRIRIRKYHNYGAFLDFGAHSPILKFAACGFTLLIGLFFLFTLFRRGNTLLKFGLALLLGGAFSNTYDRLKRSYVVDYFSLSTPWPRLNRIVFNLSDFAILIGALICVIRQA